MDKYYKKLARVFEKNFKSKNNQGDYWTKGQCDFFCENCESCKVNINKTPIYSASPGDIKTEIMFVGEAPSDSGKNNGGIISGYFKDITESKKSPLQIVREFCKINYNQIPYFTDYCKCGVSRQIKKDDLKLRFKNCFKKFLIKEIRAVSPKIIFALGNGVYNLLMENISDIKKVSSDDVKVIKLLHYSNRACLPLSIKDKMNIVWKYQAGIKDYKLNDLKFFNS